jgi:Cysteine dioxygenase type I
MYINRGASLTAADLRLDHLALAARYAATPEQWPVAPRFNPVDRWYHRLAVADEHEVWLLTWLPGQGTELHDHGGSAGAFHVVSGTLTEDTVVAGTLSGDAAVAGTLSGDAAVAGTLSESTGGRGPGGTAGAGTPARPARITARELGEGAGRRFGTRHIHRITNRGGRPAVSIHVYGPALTTMTKYRVGADGLQVLTVERAGAQW